MELQARIEEIMWKHTPTDNTHIPKAAAEILALIATEREALAVRIERAGGYKFAVVGGLSNIEYLPKHDVLAIIRDTPTK